jgi:hypothetical protein
MNNSSLVDSFSALLSEFERETTMLKSIAAVRGLNTSNCPPHLLSQINGVSGALADIERKLAHLDEFVDNEFNSLKQLNQLVESISTQTSDISELLEKTPTCFKIADSKSAVAVDDSRALTTNRTTFDVDAIEEAEFVKVPSATRGRISIVQLNIAWVSICKLFDDKLKVL